MKKMMFVPIILITFFSVFMSLGAKEIYTLRFKSSDLSFSNLDTFDLINIKGCIPSGQIGTPLLPVKRIEILIPSDKEFSSIQILSKTLIPVQGTKKIYPEQPPQMLNNQYTKEQPVIDNSIFGSSTPFPKSPIAFVEQENIGGYRLIALNITPLVYIPLHEKLFLIKEINFTVQLVNSHKALIEPIRKSAYSNSFITSLIRKRIFNPEELARNAIKTQIDSYNKKNPDETIEKPSLEGSPKDFIIITDATLQSSFENLASIKRKKGILTCVATTEWIRDNYSGRDLPERMRNFLKDAFMYWGTTWVLLGGDISLVPTRFSNFSSWEFKGEIPTDLYFSDLDGDWDADGDGLFAEYVNGCNIDSVEGNPELLVGRIPVETNQEVLKYINRVYTYEFTPDTSYTQKTLFLGASISGGGTDGWGALLSETIISSYIPSNILPYRLYAPKIDSLQNPPRWIGDEELSSLNAISNINKGFNIINHLDHGATDAIGTGVMTGGGYIHWYDADDLTNSSRPSILWSIACSSNAFDMNSVSEHFVNSPGGLAFIGNSRTGWTSQAFQDCAFFQAIYCDSITNLGAAFAATLFNSLYYRISMNLLGDPSIDIWTLHPEILQVNHRKTLIVPVDSLSFFITKHNVPAVGALIVVTKQDENIKRIAITNSEGKAVIYLKCSEPGTLSLSVSSPNALPYFESIGVNTSSAPYLTIIPEPQTMRPGSKRRIKVTAKNTGRKIAEKVQAELTSTNINVTIEGTGLKFGNILPDKQASSNFFTVKVSKQCPSGSRIKITCRLFDYKNNIWDDSLIISSADDSLCYSGHSPLIYYPDEPLNSHLKIVQVPSIMLRNYGNLTGHHIRAVLRSEDSLITIKDSTVSVDSIPANMTITTTQGFLFESCGESNAPFTINIEDRLGHIFTKNIEFNSPAQVESLKTSSRKNSVGVSWKRSLDNGLLGCYLYRRENNIWIRTFQEPITSTNWEDFSIIKGKRYIYCVTAVDSSMNESIISDSIIGVSNPPLLDGWPAYIGPGGYSVHSNKRFYDMSSPAIGDIDGDGENEIIVASNDSKIYAYNKDGSYVKGWPINIGFRLENSPAVCDLNGDGKDEVIVGGGILDTVCLYIFKGDGSNFKPGIWPKIEGGYPTTSPIIEDIDANGDYEIGIGCSNNKVYFWNIDGTAVLGWPVSVNSPVCIGAADLFGNNQVKIVISSSAGNIYVFNQDGTLQNGWPQTPGGSISSGIALSDIDADGKTEVIVGTNTKKLFVFHPDGSQKQGWPITLNETISCIPAIGDMDGDGDPEIAVTTKSNRVYAFKSTGAMLFSRDLAHLVSNYYVSPILVDIDNDGKKDLIANTVEGYLYAFDYNGKTLAGFPIHYGDGSYSSPTVASVNNNGYLDLIQKGSDRKIYVWEIKNSRKNLGEKWFKNRANNRNTCFYGEEMDDMVYENSRKVKDIKQIHFYRPFPNPFGSNVKLSIYLPQNDANRKTAILIFDASGRLIKTILNKRLKPGMNEIQWKGTNNYNKRVPSGIYFIKLYVTGEKTKSTFVKKLIKVAVKNR